jgi:hypothetical protein
LKKILFAALILLFSASAARAEIRWEKKGDLYFLTKDTRDNFSAAGAGANKFSGKYLTYNGVDFLARGADNWKDYGRIDLEGNNMFSLPIRPGMKVEEVHFLAGGNFGNRYEHDQLLRLYGDKYFYAVITVIFAYQDGGYKSLSVPVFWDWFRLGPGEWSGDGASIRSLGSNPARRDCSIFHLSFTNPRPSEPVKDILITDSWIRDYPFSEIFALTIRSDDTMEAKPRVDRKFASPVDNASNMSADTRISWQFDNGLDGWVCGSSANWDSGAFWEADSFGRKGVVVIPGCNWAGDKSSWIEKKIVIPDQDKISLEFSRHSAVYSDLNKKWSDGLLKVIVKDGANQKTVYEQVYSGQWGAQAADLSGYKGRSVIVRFENHGAGFVQLDRSTSAGCDGEDAIIDDIRLVAGK